MSTNVGKETSKLTDLRNRLLFVVFALLVYRIGAHVPVPGIDAGRLAELFAKSQHGALGYFNMLSGGALSRLTLFALGVMPYISASILMQLFSMSIPTLQSMRKEGEAGRRKINQYTRYLTCVFAVFQAFGIAQWLASEGLVPNAGGQFYFMTTITLTTGTVFLMWLGEQMTEKGVGNGISLLIVVGILARFPQAIAQVFTQAHQGQMNLLTFLFTIVLVLGVTAFVVFVERGQRKIAINYPRQHTRGSFAAKSTSLPLKINMAGVIPVIFAQSLVIFPVTIGGFFARAYNWTWFSHISSALGNGEPMHILLVIAAIAFFSFFYTAMVFNPKEIADNLKKSGALIPGIRPGEQTSSYIDKVLTRITLGGCIYLSLVALLPDIMIRLWHLPFYLGGTSLLIVVVVIMDFMTQMQSYMIPGYYDSMGKKGGGKKGGKQLMLLR